MEKRGQLTFVAQLSARVRWALTSPSPAALLPSLRNHGYNDGRDELRSFKYPSRIGQCVTSSVRNDKSVLLTINTLLLLKRSLVEIRWIKNK